MREIVTVSISLITQVDAEPFDSSDKVFKVIDVSRLCTATAYFANVGRFVTEITSFHLVRHFYRINLYEKLLRLLLFCRVIRGYSENFNDYLGLLGLFGVILLVCVILVIWVSRLIWEVKWSFGVIKVIRVIGVTRFFSENSMIILSH